MLFTSCFLFTGDEPDEPIRMSDYEPILMSREKMEASVLMVEPQIMEEPGKIYLKDNIIFVNDKYKGFHLYNNQNPTNPFLIKFLQIPGATDIAIKGNIFYINQATDLIALTYNENTKSILLTERIKNIFPPLVLPPDGRYVDYDTSKIVIGWKLK